MLWTRGRRAQVTVPLKWGVYWGVKLIVGLYFFQASLVALSVFTKMNVIIKAKIKTASPTVI
ncbi:TPA: hypothetical protein ACNGZA_005487, partial [Klebsiella michiganensis]